MGIGQYFFNSDLYKVVDGNIVYSLDLNNPFTANEAAFQKLAEGVRGADGLYSGIDTGIPNEYAMSLNPPVESYHEGLMVWLKPLNTNTGSSTIKINDLAPIPIKQTGLVDLLPGDILVGYWVQLKYSSGVFQIVSNTKRAELDDTVSVVGVSPIQVSATPETIFVALDESGVAGLMPWEIVSAYVEILVTEPNRGYAINTSLNNVGVLMPPDPDDGDTFAVLDYMSTFSEKKCILIPGAGKKIEGSTESLDLVKDGHCAIYLYTGTERGWVEISSKAASVGLPVGFVGEWATENPPDGWFEEDGTELDISEYPDLYAVLGGRYGLTNGAGAAGTTHFRLRDTRGKFKRCWDHGAGVDPGASGTPAAGDVRTDRGDGTSGDNIGTLQGGSTARPNTNFVTDENRMRKDLSVFPDIGSTGTRVSGTSATNGSGWFNVDHDHTHEITGGGDAETRPSNINVMSIIKWRA